MTLRLSRAVAPIALALSTFLFSACSRESSPPAPPTPPAPPAPGASGGTGVGVTVTPGSTRVRAGSTATFAAAVTGTIDTRVSWSVVESGGGTIDPGGVYTAPSTPGGYHVKATSVADSSVSGQSTVTVVLPVSVAISPRAPSVVAGGTVTFTAAVSGATDTTVTWAVAGTSCGSITSAGVYTAPAGAATCTVSATSHADATRSDAVTVTVTAPPPAVAVAVTPSSAAADACRTVQLRATVTNASNGAVTWTVQEGTPGGAVDATGLYTAPAARGTYHVVATSVADPTRSAIATVTVTERIVSVTVAPATPTVQAGGAQQFTATVTTTCGSFPSTTTL
jgi:hypothetical protein